MAKYCDIVPVSPKTEDKLCLSSDMIQYIKRVVDRCGVCNEERIEELRNEMSRVLDIRDEILLSEIRNILRDAGVPVKPAKP